MTIEIIEIMGRSRQGITRPFICRGDDGHVYFVLHAVRAGDDRVAIHLRYCSA
jgi:hypothetical protein